MNGLSILLDKSTLEMLNTEQLDTLCRHFFVMIPPILITEIIGDLHAKKKNSMKEDVIPTDRVVCPPNRRQKVFYDASVSDPYLFSTSSGVL
jgi:hypothetical protein